MKAGNPVYGSKEEIALLREKGADEERIQRTLEPKYIIYDMETDTSQNVGKSEAIDEKRCIHKPMKIVAFK